MKIVDIATTADHVASVLAEMGLAPRPPNKLYPIPARQLALPIHF